jgi:hypothetical protein
MAKNLGGADGMEPRNLVEVYGTAAGGGRCRKMEKYSMKSRTCSRTGSIQSNSHGPG